MKKNKIKKQQLFLLRKCEVGEFQDHTLLFWFVKFNFFHFYWLSSHCFLNLFYDYLMGSFNVFDYFYSHRSLSFLPHFHTMV